MKRLLLITLLYTGNVYAQNVPSYIDTSNLVSWHTFNNNSIYDSFKMRPAFSNDIWYQTDRFNNSGSAVYTHKYGEGPLKSKSYVDLDGYGLLNITDLTISVWTKRADNVPGAYIISSYACQVSEIVGIGFDKDSSYFKFGSYYVTTTDTLDTDWHHFVAIVNNDTGYLYIDDTLRAKKYISHWPGSNPDIQKLNLGFYANGNPISYNLNSNNGTTNYNGHIDDVAVWSKAISRAEVTKLYEAVDTNTTSVSDFKNDIHLNIYPNPATNFISVSSSEVISKVEIIDLLGRVCISKNYDDKQLNIDVSMLNAGQYFIRINDYIVKQFTKQ